MSLKNILDCFQQGRTEARLWYDDNAPLTDSEIEISTTPELVSFYAGILSRPKAVYQIAKFFVGGQALGGQGISKEEIEEDLKEK